MPKLNHKKIVSLGKAIGFFDFSKDGAESSPLPQQGVCRGITMSWLFAAMIHERERFLRRLSFINSIEIKTFKVEIEKTLALAKNRQALSPSDMQNLDVLAFYNFVSLYQYPSKLSELFGEHVEQSDISKIYSVGGSTHFDKFNGFKILKQAALIVDENECCYFLLELSKIISDAGPTGIILGGNGHSIGMFFESNHWIFFDVNQCEQIFENTPGDLTKLISMMKQSTGFYNKLTNFVFYFNIMVLGSLDEKLFHEKQSKLDVMCLPIEGIIAQYRKDLESKGAKKKVFGFFPSPADEAALDDQLSSDKTLKNNS